MKTIAHLAAALLGFIFTVIGLNYFFQFFAMPAPPADSPPAAFLGAMIASGYFGVVKALEIIGGILVAVPRTRSVGLLILGPIVVNILLFNIFLAKGAGFFPLPAAVVGLSLFLLWTERAAYARLMPHRSPARPASSTSGAAQHAQKAY